MWCAREIVGDEPFAVLLPDMVTQAGARKTRCLAQCVEAYRKHGGNIIAVEEVPLEETHKYGVVVGRRGPRARRSRSPAWWRSRRKGTAPSNLIISGRYILQPEIFEILETVERGAGGEIQLTDGMIALAAHAAVPRRALRRAHLRLRLEASASSPPTSPSRWSAKTLRRCCAPRRRSWDCEGAPL